MVHFDRMLEWRTRPDELEDLRPGALEVIRLLSVAYFATGALLNYSACNSADILIATASRCERYPQQ